MPGIVIEVSAIFVAKITFLEFYLKNCLFIREKNTSGTGSKTEA